VSSTIVSSRFPEPPIDCQAISLPPLADVVAISASSYAVKPFRLCRGRWPSLRLNTVPCRRTTQTIRAILLASATTATFRCTHLRQTHNQLPSGVALLVSDEGGSRAVQADTVRGAMAGGAEKKLGLMIESEKDEREATLTAFQMRLKLLAAICLLHGGSLPCGQAR